MRVIRDGDFIKTSTGKASGSATLANTQVMIEAIRDFYLATGIAIGMKPAGGIKNGQAGAALSRRGEGNAGRRVAQLDALSFWRELAAQRSAAPDRKGKDRRVPGALLLHRSRGELLMASTNSEKRLESRGPAVSEPRPQLGRFRS